MKGRNIELEREGEWEGCTGGVRSGRTKVRGRKVYRETGDGKRVMGVQTGTGNKGREYEEEDRGERMRKGRIRKGEREIWKTK